MLPPEYFINCEDELIELYARFQERLLRDISRRIVKTGRVTESAYNQIEILQQSGELYDDVIQELSGFSGKSTEILQDIFNDAAVESIGNDNVNVGLKKNDLNLSPAILQQIEAGILKTDGHIKNLTKTTALSSQTAYINACSLAEMDVSSGAFSYTEAIRHAIDVASDECATVHYPSGAKASVDVAIRRSVMTGITQTAASISLMNCDTIGTDLVEVSAHAGARPSHAEWQGGIYCIRGSRGRYRDFYKETGYGTGDGLCGWNCSHSFWPYLEGVSTPAYSKKYIEELNNRTVEYNGKSIPQYEAEQKQRAMERQIRKERAKLAGYDEAIKAADGVLKAGLKNDFDALAYKMKAHEAKYKDFSKQTGLRTQTERLQIKGFNKSVSQKAVYSAKKLENPEKYGIINIGKSVGAKALNYNVYDPDTGDFFHFVEGSRIINCHVFAGKGTSRPLKEEVALGLSEQIGGEPKNWQHAKGRGVLDYYGEEREAEVHWFQESSVGRHKFKVKRWIE